LLRRKEDHLERRARTEKLLAEEEAKIGDAKESLEATRQRVDVNSFREILFCN